MNFLHAMVLVVLPLSSVRALELPTFCQTPHNDRQWEDCELLRAEQELWARRTPGTDVRALIGAVMRRIMEHCVFERVEPPPMGGCGRIIGPE